MRWGYGKPPRHAGSKKGQSGNRAGGRLVPKPGVVATFGGGKIKNYEAKQTVPVAGP